MSLKKIALAVAMIGVAAGSATQTLAQTLRVGSETVYPPFEYLDSATGKYVGFDIDLLEAVAKHAGLTPKITSMGLDGLIPALMSGSVDVAVSALTITKERSAKVDFTKPYYQSGLSIMTTKDEVAKIRSTRELEGKTLCVEIGSSGALYSSKIPGTKIRTFNSAAEAFMEINQGGCYAMINDRPVNEYFLTQQSQRYPNLAEVPLLLVAEQYGFAVKKGNKALREKLNAGLDAVRKNGTYNAIHKKWFGVNAPSEN